MKGTTGVSHSVWSAWIEMSLTAGYNLFRSPSHSVWSAWIEMLHWQPVPEPACMSHSVWSAWIEIKQSPGSSGSKDSRTPFGVRG